MMLFLNVLHEISSILPWTDQHLFCMHNLWVVSSLFLCHIVFLVMPFCYISILDNTIHSTLCIICIAPQFHCTNQYSNSFFGSILWRKTEMSPQWLPSLDKLCNRLPVEIASSIKALNMLILLFMCNFLSAQHGINVYHFNIA